MIPSHVNTLPQLSSSLSYIPSLGITSPLTTSPHHLHLTTTTSPSPPPPQHLHLTTSTSPPPPPHHLTTSTSPPPPHPPQYGGQRMVLSLLDSELTLYDSTKSPSTTGVAGRRGLPPGGASAGRKRHRRAVKTPGRAVVESDKQLSFTDCDQWCRYVERYLSPDATLPSDIRARINSRSKVFLTRFHPHPPRMVS